MLAGLRSRWTMPAWWAWWTAAAQLGQDVVARQLWRRRGRLLFGRDGRVRVLLGRGGPGVRRLGWQVGEGLVDLEERAELVSQGGEALVIIVGRRQLARLFAE